MTDAEDKMNHNRFATTHWSLVIRAGRGSDAAQAGRALQLLCESYWQPVYSYIRRKGHREDEAQDLTQEFFLRLLERKSLAVAQPERGKFRGFLLVSLRNFLSDNWDKNRARKRGGGETPLSLDFSTGEQTYRIEPVNNVTPDQLYERRWAMTLLDKVLACLQEEYRERGREQLFLQLSPCLAGERALQPYGVLAGELGVTESTVKSMVHRMRGRYRELLRGEVANTVDNPDEVDKELRYLIEILARN